MSETVIKWVTKRGPVADDHETKGALGTLTTKWAPGLGPSPNKTQNPNGAENQSVAKSTREKLVQRAEKIEQIVAKSRSHLVRISSDERESR